MRAQKLRFVTKRLFWGIFRMFIVLTATFGVLQYIPGGPFHQFASSRPYPPQCVEIVLARYGERDEPAWKHYLIYVERLFFHFDFGPSRWCASVNERFFGVDGLELALEKQISRAYGAKSERIFFSSPGYFDSSVQLFQLGPPDNPWSIKRVGQIDIGWSVRKELFGQFLSSAPMMVSLQLWGLSAIAASLVGVPIGIATALTKHWRRNRVGKLILIIGVTAPGMVLGIGLQMVLGVWLDWLPLWGWGENWEQIVLPVVTLAVSGAAFVGQLTQRSIAQRSTEAFVITARAKGLQESTVALRYILRNSLIPFINRLGTVIGGWLLASCIVEWIFSVRGIGRAFVAAAYDRDYPTLLGGVVLFSMMLVLVNFVVDVLHCVVAGPIISDNILSVNTPRY